jgi:2-hydroxychromene-2-carboxylate isomerase
VTQRLEFHFDFGSPNAYLAHRVLPTIEERTGLSFEYVPVLLGGVFKATGNVSPAISMQGIKNKGVYQQLEIQRFIARNEINDFAQNPHFPVNTLLIMRGAIAAERMGCFPRYVDEVYRHMWSEPKKMDDPQVIHAALASSDLPAEELIAATQDPEIKAKLLANTEASVARGNFGSPSFFLGDEIYFGKDSLRELEDAIRASN